jgi:hypothetical protein
VIVATISKVTIYDGDDPDLPMWMVFNSGAANSIYGGDGSTIYSNGVVAISASNGTFCFCKPQKGPYLPQNGFRVFSLISEKIQLFTGSSSYSVDILGNIASRNESNVAKSLSSPDLNSNYSNDVAMTVLPNAPIDSVTGLPVPTIAVATNGGVSVIRDDGTVANLTYSSLATQTVTFDKNNGLWVCFGGVGSSIGWYYYTNFTTTSTLPSIYHSNSGWSGIWDVFGGVYYKGIGYNYSDFSTGTSALTNFNGFGAIKASTTMSNFITSSYNTGWMHGDIKGAWLSDTSTASVTGTELVTNGTFTTDTSGWTTNGSTLSISSNKLVVTITSAYGYAYQSVPTVIGKTYTLSFSYFRSAGQPNPWVYLGNVSHSAMVYGERLTDSSAEVSDQITFVATTTTAFIVLRVNGTTAGNFATFDNVSLRLAEADRSVNNKGLQVYGTITKTPVATGSNLVAYGGFDASNYLYQPHSASLSFGTNDFCVMYWYQNIAGDEINIQKNTRGADGWRIVPGNVAGDLYIVNGNFTTYGVLSGISNKNVWNHWAIIRKYNVGWHIYKNGVLVGNIVALSGNNFNEISPLTVGSSTATSNLMSLLRISQSVPSPEQIKKIYEDEKVLFQSNSQATLFGSSDAVTALAYDDTTSLLHVGTSSGRSEFKGLKRVGNTTTAVTTSISASNGLVAEQ